MVHGHCARPHADGDVGNVGAALFYSYAALRILHSICYVKAIQPFRTISFVLALTIQVAVLGLIGYGPSQGEHAHAVLGITAWSRRASLFSSSSCCPAARVGLQQHLVVVAAALQRRSLPVRVGSDLLDDGREDVRMPPERNRSVRRVVPARRRSWHCAVRRRALVLGDDERRRQVCPLLRSVGNGPRVRERDVHRCGDW